MLREIIRVETFSEAGPYRGAPGNFWDQDLDHPLLWEDGMRISNPLYFFGFASEAQYRNWFETHQNWIELHKHKLQLSIYLVDQSNIQEGKRQVSFKKGLAAKLAYAEPPYPGEPIRWIECPAELTQTPTHL